MRDESGGIEGMPLQLMILVIVTGLVLAVVLGWTLSIQGPTVIKSVSTDPESITIAAPSAEQAATKTVTIKVSAFDAKDQPVRGIVVSLGGAVARPYVAQDSADGTDGTATFAGVTVVLPPGVTLGELTLTIQKSGYPTRMWSIPVLRGA
jgi:hypothetical protein